MYASILKGYNFVNSLHFPGRSILKKNHHKLQTYSENVDKMTISFSRTPYATILLQYVSTTMLVSLQSNNTLTIHPLFNQQKIVVSYVDFCFMKYGKPMGCFYLLRLNIHYYLSLISKPCIYIYF